MLVRAQRAYTDRASKPCTTNSDRISIGRGSHHVLSSERSPNTSGRLGKQFLFTREVTERTFETAVQYAWTLDEAKKKKKLDSVSG
ncbi:hypothetical protein RB195_009914 [Necator americanus]|uniref:Uncharacterized protein n=1 Tax=Necator americanus TaxID=51031 RepID=A0ABR1CXY0_NECAM